MPNGSMRPLYRRDTNGREHVRAYKVEWTTRHGGRSKTFAANHKAIAEKFLQKVRMQTALEEVGMLPQVQTTVSEFFLDTFWKGEASKADKTRENKLSHWNKWIAPAIGDTPMKDVTIDDIEELLTEISGQGMSETPRKVRRLLVGMWDLAMRRDVVTRNVAKEARIIVQPAAFDLNDDEESDDIDVVYDVLSVDDIRNMVSFLAEPFQILVQVMASTGMRGGEAAALRVKDFDAVKGQIRITKSWSAAKAGRGGSGVKRTKTSGSARTIVLKKSMSELLSKHVDGRKPTDRLFTSLNGANLDMKNFSRRDWARAREKAGVPAHFTPHSLRHFAASQMLQHEPVQVVYRHLGHASPAVTQRIYSHFILESNDALLRAVEAMPDLTQPAKTTEDSTDKP